MRLNNTKIIYSALFLVSMLLSACGGGGAAPAGGGSVSYTVGGSVSGLTGSVVLQDNGGDNFSASTNGNFTFATSVTSGSAYNVTILTQPTGQTCTVSTGAGTISGNVTNVALSCSNNPSVGGSVSGLVGSVVLQDNGGDNLTVLTNGTFTFATKLASGSAYNVTVLTQPTAQTCSVSTGAGAVSGGNVTNVAVVCSVNTYSVGGTISGLAGGSVVLQNNNGDNLTIAADGTFTFATQVASGSPYSVTVLTQPTGRICTVTAGSGTLSGNVTNVAVVCSVNTYSVGGTISGLAGGSVVLQDNNGDNLTIAANGTFTFATQVASGSPYSVTVLTQPAGRRCIVTAGSGTLSGNVTNVTVACTNNLFTVGGSVTGLTGSVVLQNNGGDNLTIPANGAFTFATTVAGGSAYNVTVLTQPTGQICTVTSGIGTISGNVTNVVVACTNNLYTVGGSVTGLTGSVVLQDNLGDNLTVAASGNFTFATPVTNGNTYSATVLTQPTGQTCSVSTGTGTVSGSNVANVAVVCSTNSYSVGGTVSGLTGPMVLQDNNGDNLTVAANGVFTFVTQVANGSPYSVSVLTQPTGQSCSVTSGTGTIAAASVTSVTVTCASYTYTIGGTVTGLNGSMVLQDNGGDNLTVAVNGIFTFTTTVALGNAYNVTLLSQQFPNQVCTITGGSGPVSANVTNVAVNCVTYTTPRYAFTANYTDNSVSTYVVDNTTGRLKYIGKVTAGTGTYAVTVDPSGKYAYVANYTSNNVSQYTISASGSLTPMPTVAAGTNPQSVTVDPSGKYAYVANSTSNNVSQYTIGAGGALIPMAPAAVATGTNPLSVTVDPSGKYAYVANSASNNVSQYTMAANGALTPMTTSTVAAGTGPTSVTVDPSSKYAYVANSASNNVSQYTVGAGGVLTPMSTSTVAAGMNPQSVTVDPSAKYAYVANFNSSTLSQYSIGVGGALTPMPTPTVTTGVAPYSITVDPSGKYAYVANFSSNSVSQFIVGVGGALTPLAPATVADATGPASITITAGNAPVQAVPQYAYVANFSSNNISQYTITPYSALIIASSGALTPMASPTVGAGTQPQSVTVDPSGKYAYVANYGSNNVSQYTINAGGAMTPMATVAAGTSPRNITVDPSGKYAYVANFGSNNVSQYTINASGALTPMATPTVAAGTNPEFVTVDPSSKYVYVANLGSGVSQYTIGAGGALTPMTPASVVAGTGATSVAVDSSGHYVYVANYVSYNISQYTIGAGGALVPMATPTVAAAAQPTNITIDPSGKYAYVTNFYSTSLYNNSSLWQCFIGVGGALTCNGTVVTGTQPLSVTVDPSGQYAYVANWLSNNVSQYTKGANGALTPMTTATVAAGTGPYSVITTGTWQ